MNKIDKNFIDALNYSISGELASWKGELTHNEWLAFLRAAKKHDILPLLVHAAYSSGALSSAGSNLQRIATKQARDRVICQAAATAEFELLYSFLKERGLDPIVMKGIILRNLYPYPELRPSTDEDLMISEKEFPAYHQAMLEYGLTPVCSGEDFDEVHEVAYENKELHLYIELHKTLFPWESDAYGNLNILFEGVAERCVMVSVYGQEYRTLAPTDHFLYMVCHAYKHFLHSGVGIRQVADMAIFANTYGAEIDWYYIFFSCQKVHIEVFAAALLHIANKYLSLLVIPDPFISTEVDEEPLLEDILTGGLYGMADIDRAHSGNITLDAVAARQQGRKRRGIWRSLFPGTTYLKKHFPYAKKYSILLPVAWAQRIIGYFVRNGSSKGNPAQSIQIGQARIELLKKYKIV